MNPNVENLPAILLVGVQLPLSDRASLADIAETISPGKTSCKDNAGTVAITSNSLPNSKIPNFKDTDR